jgi:hypothetical protein
MNTETKDEPVMGEIVPYAQPGVVEEYRPRIVMEAAEAKALDDQLRASMRAVLRPEVDYGKIPGSNKDSLLKPGAEKLLQWFGFGHTLEQTEVERDSDGRWCGVTYRCTVSKGMPDGRSVTVATCDGYAGYDEDRFYVTAEQAAAKEQANATRYKRSVQQWKCVEYRAPRNSVIKMAQKRAMVGAALQATSASSLFTQDMEDMVDPAAAVPAALASAGRAAIAALPQAVGAELDAWYTTLNWPGPDTWDAERWCKALVKAGKLSAGPAASEAAANGNGAQHVAPPVQGPTDQEWVTIAIARAGGFASPKEGEKLWAEVVGRHQEGRVADGDRQVISDLMKARLEDLRKPAADPTSARTAGTQAAGSARTGTGDLPGLDPGDEWAVKAGSILSDEDAEAARADLATTSLQAKDPERYHRILAAIDAKAASLHNGAGVAA